MATNPDRPSQEQTSAPKAYKWLSDIFKSKAATPSSAPAKDKAPAGTTKPHAHQGPAAASRLRIVDPAQTAPAAPAPQPNPVRQDSADPQDQKIFLRPAPAPQALQSPLVTENLEQSGTALNPAAISGGSPGPQAMPDPADLSATAPEAVQALGTSLQGFPQEPADPNLYPGSDLQAPAEAAAAGKDKSKDLIEDPKEDDDPGGHTVIVYSPLNTAPSVPQDDKKDLSSSNATSLSAPGLTQSEPAGFEQSLARDESSDPAIARTARTGAFYAPPKEDLAKDEPGAPALSGTPQAKAPARADDDRPATVISRTEPAAAPLPLSDAGYGSSSDLAYLHPPVHSYATRIEDHTGDTVQQSSRAPAQADGQKEAVPGPEAQSATPAPQEQQEGEALGKGAKAKAVPVKFMMLGENFCITCQEDDEALMRRAIAKIEELAASTLKANPGFSPLQAMIIAALRLEFDHQKEGAAPQAESKDLQEVEGVLDDLTKLAAKIQDECKPLC